MPLKKARFRISEYNQTRKRRLQGQERKIRMISLSLTSMVDMFAILVVFLLMNSSTVAQWIEISGDITLPKAKHSEDPEKALTVEIGQKEILADRKPVMAITGLDAANNPLRALLGGRKGERTHINIVAHEDIAFGVLKKVIAISQGSGYKQVNLAVQPTN